MLTDEQLARLQHCLDHHNRNGSVCQTHVAIPISDLRSILAASAARAEGRELNAVERVGLIRQALSVVKQDYSGECSQMATRREYVEDAVSQLIDAGYRTATAPTMSEAARTLSTEEARRIYDAACLAVTQRKFVALTFDAWCSEFIPALLTEIQRIDRAAAKGESDEQ